MSLIGLGLIDRLGSLKYLWSTTGHPDSSVDYEFVCSLFGRTSVSWLRCPWQEWLGELKRLSCYLSFSDILAGTRFHRRTRVDRPNQGGVFEPLFALHVLISCEQKCHLGEFQVNFEFKITRKIYITFFVCFW